MAVDRIACAIEHAAQKFFAQAEGRTPSPHDDLVAVTDADGTAQGHGKDSVPAESDDFSGPVVSARVDDFAGLADGAERAFGFDQLPNDLYHTAAPAQRGGMLEVGEVGGEDRRRRDL